MSRHRQSTHDYELTPFEEFHFDKIKNIQNAIKIRKAKNKNSEFYYSLNQLLDKIEEYKQRYPHIYRKFTKRKRQISIVESEEPVKSPKVSLENYVVVILMRILIDIYYCRSHITIQTKIQLRILAT